MKTDLIYKIYSVWLYQSRLDHDFIFFYNRKTSFSGRLDWNAPYYMFSNSDLSATMKIYRMDKNDPDFIEKSINIMRSAADKYGIKLINAKDIISLIPCGESHISYSGAQPGDVVETEGKYKGLKKNIYTPYDIMFNETKAGFNPHDFEVMGVWNGGESIYTAYRIWEEAHERGNAIRNQKLEDIGI